MLAAGRGDRRRTTSTDCHAAAGVSIVPRGDTAVAMPTATACSHTDSPSTATTSRTCAASAAAPTTAAPAMGECGRYRQGCDSESEREHSKHCHVGTAFLRPGIGTRTTERASPLRLAPQREAGIAGTKHHSCHAGLHVASRTGFPYGHRKQ